MNGHGNQTLPTATVSPARLRLCQPTQRPIYMAGEKISTAWGWCKVTGRFGQRHQDALEVFMWCAEAVREIEDGGVELLVDPARVRRTMSDSGYSLGRLRILIDDLMGVTIELKVTNGLWVLGGLLDHVKESPATKPNPLDRGTRRRLWRVRLGVAFVQLIKNDVPLHYDPAPIARLQSGVSQAVARHVLSHSSQPNGGWKLDGLIEAVCGELESTSLRHRRRELKIDSLALAKIGIIINGERVSRDSRACSTGPIKREKTSKRAAPARCRAAPTRKNIKACSTGPGKRHSFRILQDLSGPEAVAPEGAAASSALSPPVADATTPQGVKSPAGEEFSISSDLDLNLIPRLSTLPPAGRQHPPGGSPRKRRGGWGGESVDQMDLLLEEPSDA